MSFFISLSTYELFSFKDIESKIASLYFLAFSPSMMIVLIIGFSSTIIVKILFTKLVDIFEKNLVSYNFLITPLISSVE